MTKARSVAALSAFVDLLIIPALWLAAGASCASEAGYLRDQLVYYRFEFSLFDLVLLGALRGTFVGYFIRNDAAASTSFAKAVVYIFTFGSVAFGAVKTAYYAMYSMCMGCACSIPTLDGFVLALSLLIPILETISYFMILKSAVVSEETMSLLSGNVQDAKAEIIDLEAAKKPGTRASLARVIGLARPHWKPVTGGTVAMLLAGVTSLAIPAFFGKVVDTVVSTHDEKQLVFWVLWLLLILSISSIFTFFRAWLFEYAGQALVANLRVDLFDALARQDVAFFDETRTGELTNRLSSDTQVIQNAATVNISMTLRYILQIVGSIIILFILSWRLTLVMLAVVPIVAIGAVVYGRFLQKLKKQFQDALADSSTVAEEAISNMRTVRAFAQEERIKKSFKDSIMNAFAFGRKGALAMGFFQGGLGLIAQAAIALVLWYGGHLVINGTMSAGLLISFLFYTLQVAMAFAMLSSVYGDFMSAVGASERVFELLDRIPQMSISGGKDMKTVTGEVKFEHVHFKYPSRPDTEVLKDINLLLEPGKVIAVVGPSGSGKSTIVSMIERFYDPSAGTVYLDGENIRSLDPRWYRKQIGLVNQEPVLFAASISDNISFGVVHASEEQIQSAAKEANAHEFISNFTDGYKTLVGERGVRLSGGQKQRIAIARALLKDPKVLLLDEATSALDSESEHLVQEAIDRLMVGRTVLVVAHRLSTVRNAHCVLVVKDGEIVERGTHDELMEHGGIYRKLVKRQLQH